MAADHSDRIGLPVNPMFLKRIFGNRLAFDWKIVAVTISSTLLIMIDAYHRITPAKGYDRTILYLLAPLAIIVLVFRETPADYGFQPGDWKSGLAITAGGIVLMSPVLWLIAHAGPMRVYYAPRVAGLPWSTLLDLFGWEFLFRGFLLFSYARRLGPQAIWLQAVPFALAHIGKPELETLSTIFGGFALGWIAYRTRSFLYPFVLHWFMATFVILVAAGLLG
jgi:membrane protease YdiL (CAAX protease family)